MTKEDLVGVYRTLGDDTVSADGKVTSDESRTAQIMYSPDGYMAVVSMPNGRKLAATTSGGPDLNGATPEERAEAAKGMVCYAGHYELKDGVLHHHVEMALNPNAVGQTIIRRRRTERRRSHAVLGAGRGRQLPPHPLAAGRR